MLRSALTCRPKLANQTPRGEATIARRHYHRDAPPVERHRVNHRIRIDRIRVIDPDGEQLGIMTPDEGRERAEELGLDLVEVAPNADPPVCRIMDYGKFKYQESKKKSASKSDRVELKTFRLRPNIGEHDLEVKLKKAVEAIEKGDQVKLIMRMRGRERAFVARWIERLDEIIDILAERIEGGVFVSQSPKEEGRQIGAIVEPPRQN